MKIAFFLLLIFFTYSCISQEPYPQKTSWPVSHKAALFAYLISPTSAALYVPPTKGKKGDLIFDLRVSNHFFEGKDSTFFQEVALDMGLFVALFVVNDSLSQYENCGLNFFDTNGIYQMSYAVSFSELDQEMTFKQKISLFADLLPFPNISETVEVDGYKLLSFEMNVDNWAYKDNPLVIGRLSERIAHILYDFLLKDNRKAFSYILIKWIKNNQVFTTACFETDSYFFDWMYNLELYYKAEKRF